MTKKISYGMSYMLIYGCKAFADTALDENSIHKPSLAQKNMASLIFGYTSIEAYLNEVISISEVSDNLSIAKEYLDVLIEIEKKLSIKEKYNLLAGLIKANLWDSSKEPFQSFEIIQAIRNEVIHHKGKWHEEGEIPINRLKPLFNKFKLKISPESSWQEALFDCNKFGIWVYDVSKELQANIRENLFSKIEK